LSARLHIDELGRLMTVSVAPGGAAPRPPAFFALRQQHGRENKCEIRDSIPRRWERASETGTKGHSVETQSGSSDRRQRFDHWGLDDWDLSRDLDLRSRPRGAEIRISPCCWPHAIDLGGSGAELLRSTIGSHACARASWADPHDAADGVPSIPYRCRPVQDPARDFCRQGTPSRCVADYNARVVKMEEHAICRVPVRTLSSVGVPPMSIRGILPLHGHGQDARATWFASDKTMQFKQKQLSAHPVFAYFS